MVRYIIRDLDFLGNRITPGNRGVARIKRSFIDTNTPGVSGGVEPIAGKPIVPPTRFAFRTVSTIAAGLSWNVCAFKKSFLEAVFGSLILDICRKISRSQEFIDKSLILAYTPTEHAAVIAVVVYAPLDLHNITRSICGDRCVSPAGSWFIVIDAGSCIPSTRTTLANLCLGKIWPSNYRLEDSAFRT